MPDFDNAYVIYFVDSLSTFYVAVPCNFLFYDEISQVLNGLPLYLEIKVSNVIVE